MQQNLVPLLKKELPPVLITVSINQISKALIREDARGHFFICEPNAPRYKLEISIAFEVARIIKHIHHLDHDPAVMISYREFGDTSAPEIWILGNDEFRSLNADSESAISVFLGAICNNEDIFLNHGPSEVPEECKSVIDGFVDEIKREFSGHSFSRQISVESKGVNLAILSGRIQDKESGQVPDVRIDHVGRYDGRRLSRRLAYFLTRGGRNSAIEIFYDEDKFGDIFLDLEKNPNQLLKLTCLQVTRKNKSVFQLVDIHPAAEDDFDITLCAQPCS